MWTWGELLHILEEKGDTNVYEQYMQAVSEEDFLISSRVHGMAHTRRVLLHTLSLVHLLVLNEADKKLLCLASIYHDIGRVNDGPDPEHGRRSWQKAVHKPLVEELSDEERAILSFIIENHCLDDRVGLANVSQYLIQDQQRACRLLKVFKDADGLDRVRIYDLNPAWLRNEEARQLSSAAWTLFKKEGEDYFGS